MTTVLLIAIFLSVSFWAHCAYFRRLGTLPYRSGFDIFSQFQWLACAIGLVHAFGWLWGAAAFAFTIFLLQFPTRFTVGLALVAFFKDDPRPTLALFSLSVIALSLISVAHLIWGDRIIY